MVNYNLNSAPAKAFKPVTDAELMESIENVSAAAEALVDAGVAVEHVVQCMDNVQLALTAIQNGGVTKQMLKTFNGCGELSALLGQENLTPAGLESFADAQITKVTSVYTAGLEGKMAEYWNKFVAWLKNLWAKIVNWFKGMFTNRAKYAKVLKEGGDVTDAQFENAKNKKIRAMKLDKANASAVKYQALVDEIKRCAAAVKAKSTTNLADEPKFDEKVITEFEESVKDEYFEERTLADLYGNATAFNKLISAYIAEAGNQKLMVASKDIDTAFKTIITDAGNAGSLEGDAAKDVKEAVNARRATLMTLLKACRIEARHVMKAGAIALKAKRMIQSK